MVHKATLPQLHIVTCRTTAEREVMALTKLSGLK